jgi:asparaginyl-tRNA synthetase
MIEPEIAFGNVHDVMDLAEDYLKYVLRYAVDNNKDDMDFFDLRIKKGIKEYLKKIVETKFAKITYTEAIDLLEKVINNYKEYLLKNK